MTTSVYPRWRGEHRITPRFLPRQRGLSPLARGTLHEPKFQGWDSRFIPAGAGNTYILKRLLNHKTVYPRWRGGTPVLLFCAVVTDRFIPAGAGNTPTLSIIMVSDTVYPRWRGEHSNHNLLLINDFLSQSQSTNFIVSHKQHIHYVKEHLIH
ncbi:hypothetical protein AB19_2199 [Escherichia coli 3-373-03_S1_C1]|nr:hypothetical protein AB47_2035 [Escherichia coli 3-373-03_S1_C2]KDU39690.1 hypothetical protein AB77_2499 [Escherichia coli 3-373-03_S1_C3]KDU46400.1 hypothetical protein AB19_2199 [Escherichia coli 3-373-03_S1_C1]